MEKRGFERIQIDISSRFPCDSTFCSGNVTNLSESGMYINAEIYFPIDTKFEVLVKLRDGILKIPVKLIRIVKSGNIYDGLGVKLLSLPKKYLELLIKLRLGL